MNDESASATFARFPDEYGERTPDDLLAWSYVEEKLRVALNYWLGTISPGGRPHVRPVDGVWVEGALCFGGSPETRWARNLQENRAASVNLASETEAIILEGDVELITDAAHPLAVASTPAQRAKYPQYAEQGLLDEFHPFWALRPKRAYAWSLEGFPKRATKWTFKT